MNFFTTPKILTAAALLLACASMNSQSLVATIVTQPCANNGQISVTATGLTPPISYTYNNWMANITIVHSGVNSTTDNLTGISAYQSIWGNPNDWDITASDGVNSALDMVTLNKPFTDSLQVIPATCPALSTVQATMFQGGTAPYVCVWTNLQTNISYTANPAPVPNGQYQVVITDGAGCMVTSLTGTFGINVQSNSSINLAMSGSAANCANGTASVTASGGTGPYTYLWSNNATSQNISGLTMGQKSVIVTDAQGCQKTGWYYVQQSVTINFNATPTSATCLQNNGSALGFVTGGTGPYTFMWSNGATTQNLSNVQGGAYNVQITDANGCMGQGWVNIQQSSPINVTYITTPSSCTLASGGATLAPTGGATPYTIVWYSFPTNSTGTSISNKLPGTYNFKVTDANGCIKTGAALINSNTTLNGSVNSVAVVCPANSANLNAIVSGSHPPFTYLWSNSATTATITNVPLGSYSVKITDATGCAITKYGNVSQVSNVNVGFNTTPATCLFSANGSATAAATGGQSPYTYVWSNSQTGPTISGLTTGPYYVTVTDANGCKNTSNNQNSQAYVGYNSSNNSCYCTITGTVYNDANSNCAKNTGENGIGNVMIHCSGIGYVFTNSNGVYSFQVPTGTYTISETVPAFHPLASCQSNNQVVAVVAATNCVSNVNFANTTLPVHDLKINTWNSIPPIPGNNYQQSVIVENVGTLTESTIKLGYAHDGQLGYSGSTPWAMTQQNSTTYPNWYSIMTGFSTLAPNVWSSSNVNYNVPTNIPINTVLNYHDTVTHAAPISTTWLTDNSPWNNVDHYQPMVVSSYDPNFKEVSPKGTGPQGVISQTVTELDYAIHFQNEGTYYAQNIVLVDTLDSDVSITSLRPGFSTHKYTTTVSNNGVVKFHFNNINLAWKSQFGNALSSGMVAYSIKLKSNLPNGTQIKNKAAIYFDYNEPVITNETVNTIGTPVGIDDVRRSSVDHATLYPNPANNYFMLRFTAKEITDATFAIYDVSGREVSSTVISLQEGENAIYENTTHLQNGIYFVVVKSENSLIQKKLLIAK